MGDNDPVVIDPDPQPASSMGTIIGVMFIVLIVSAIVWAIKSNIEHCKKSDQHLSDLNALALQGMTPELQKQIWRATLEACVPSGLEKDQVRREMRYAAECTPLGVSTQAYEICKQKVNADIARERAEARVRRLEDEARHRTSSEMSIHTSF